MPAGPINTGSHPVLLWPGVYDTWGQVYAEHPEEYPQLYDVRESDQAYEILPQITPFGTAPVKSEGAPVSWDSELQGPITRAQPTAYALGYIVTFEELRDNLYEKVASRRAAGNAFSMRQTMELVGAFPFNSAFATTFQTTADGVAWCSTAHVNTTGGTYSNALNPAADLSEASLEDLTIQIMQATDDRGNLISVMPRSLHIAVQEWYNANRILKSVLQSDSANNNINVLKATNVFPGGIHMNHYFSNPHSWFIRTNVQEGLIWFWRDHTMFDQDNDFDTKNAKAASYMRFSTILNDPRGLYGSNGP